MSGRFDARNALLVLCAVLAIVLSTEISLVPAARVAAAAGPKIRVTVLMSNAGDPYFANKSYGYQEYANEDPGVELQFLNAGGYDKLEVQVQQIEDAIQRGTDVLLVTPVDAKGVCPAVGEAIKKGIVVVADDTGIECNFKVPLFVTENSHQMGFEQCKFLAERIGGKGGIVALWGAAGPAHIRRRQQGCLDALKQFPGVKLLAGEYGGHGVEDGLRLTEDFITRFGHNIKAIYSAGSVIADGASRALKAAGYKPGQIPLVGIDMTEQSIKLMNDGWFQGIQAAQPVRVAYLVTKYGVALKRGQKIPGGAGVFSCCQLVLLTTDYMVVTPEIFKTFPTDLALAPAGWAPPIK
jgi:ABC-type sugar transport system substrate-binding protein